MNLLELKKAVDSKIEYAKECLVDPKDINVSIQLDIQNGDSIWSDEVEVLYDNDGNVSGCVLFGYYE